LKHVRHPRLYAPAAAALALGLIAAFGPMQGSGVSAQQAPPAPPGPAGQSTPSPTYAPLAPIPSSAPSDLGSPAPTPTPTPQPGKHHRGAAPSSTATATPEPTSTPTSPAFATLDGTWELQLQFINGTTYSYLTIAQQPSGTISGVWKIDGKNDPFEGTYDGRLIHMLVKRPTGNVTMSGYVEGASDMVGIVDLGTTTGTGNGNVSTIAFTAEHRGGNKTSIFKKKSGS
jgi:hypothetical protein